MDNDTVIKVENLSKKFTRSLKRSMAYGSLDLARNFLGISSHPEKLRKGEFWALKDISFELRRGESLGLIGSNGSGKSTLLRMLTGIFPPDTGSISIQGRVGSLIAVGAGFHPHMTGRENIYLNGTILGMRRSEIDSQFEEIVDFADIGEFIDAPVSTYSSGMRVRLGFSIAVHAVPDILLVDEVLSVGDMNFRQKCMTKMGEIVDRGTSLILVSHQMGYIQNICDKSLLLENGELIKSGNTIDVVSKYYAISSSTDGAMEEKPQNISDMGIKLKHIDFYNDQGVQTTTFGTGDNITVKWAFEFPKKITNAVLTFSLSDGVATYNGYQTLFDGIKINEIQNGSHITLKLKDVALSPGEYTVSIGVWDENLLTAYYWDFENTGKITMESKRELPGRFQFAHEWQLDSIDTSTVSDT